MNATSQDQLLSKAFSWFTGVVEDISDPMQMGRVRVRCFGYHTEDKSQIETKDLPWAFVVQPVTSAAMGGIGTSPTGILSGSWVVGFFRDGPSAQDPLILGTIASMPVAPDKDRGFSDPSGQYPRLESLGSPDIPKQSTNEYSQASSYIRRNDLRSQNIETAVPPKVSSVAVDEPDSYYTRQSWSNFEVDQVVAPVYPNNRATETKSGHVFEVDDTPGFERISEMHTSGTYREIDATGNITTTVVGNRYTVVFESDNIYIMGSCNITVDGDLKQLVKGNYHLEVEGNKTEYIKGSRQSKIGQSEQTEIGKEWATNVTSNRIERVGGNTVITVDGNKVQTIAGNSDLTVAGNNGLIVVGKHQEFSGGHHETSSSGHLYLTSKENIEFESLAAMKITVDGNQDISAAVTNIANNVNVTGTVDATVEVEAGSNNIKLTTHRHSGVQAGLSNTALPIP
jgi:hypothetical protein